MNLSYFHYVNYSLLVIISYSIVSLLRTSFIIRWRERWSWEPEVERERHLLFNFVSSERPQIGDKIHSQKASQRLHPQIWTAGHDLSCVHIRDRWAKLAERWNGWKLQPSSPGVSKSEILQDGGSQWMKNHMRETNTTVASCWRVEQGELMIDKNFRTYGPSLKIRKNF